MKKIKGWWFAPRDNKLGHEDGRRVKVGITHKVKGKIIPCKHGLHVSPKILDALLHADSGIVYKVVGSGIIIPHGDPIDKYVCSQRTYLAGGIDISDIVRMALDTPEGRIFMFYGLPGARMKRLNKRLTRMVNKAIRHGGLSSDS